MRIVVVHNPEAGDEELKPEELMKALAKAGHKAVYQSAKKKKGLKKTLKKKADLVLVAGGDGTVGLVAKLLLGRKLPLSVLPLGTANNLARTLGFCAPAKELIAQLAQGERSGFDVGKVRGPWGKSYLFEGAGAGLFADHLYEYEKRDRENESGSKAAQMRRHVRELQRRLRTHPARRWEIELDGEDVSGRYLLWQAMNIRSVGPVLALAPQAATDDGKFDFVGAREADRELLLKHLDARLAGGKPKFPLPIRRFRKMRVRWEEGPLHLDDEVWPAKDEKRPKPCLIKLAVKEAALEIWRTD